MHLLDDYTELAPPQPKSITNTLVELVIPCDCRLEMNKDTDSDPVATDTSELARDIRVQLRVDASPGCGGITWPAGEVLARYIARRRRSILAGKHVLELGSGTGLVGLIAARLGAHVYITDQAPLLPIMQANVLLNGLADVVSVCEYNWGTPRPSALPSRIDVILAADCVYFEPAFPLLVSTLCDLVADDESEILFCYKKRRKADKRFFNLLKRHFNWMQVEDDIEFATYSREAISLLCLTPKRRLQATLVR